MPRLIVHDFTISLGGYGAGPEPSLEVEPDVPLLFLPRDEPLCEC
jgi:hypothetical protein